MTDSARQNDDPGVLLVIGASGGIGSALTRRLASVGNEIFVAGRDRARLDALATETGATAIEVDATDFASVDACFEEAAAGGRPLAGVVSCVGSVLLKPAHLTTPAEWAQTIATNLTSAFAVVRAAGRTMRGRGSVVLVSSVAAETGLANHEAIAAAKGGVSALVRAAAASYAPRGLRFNAVSPGLVRTPATERITSNPRSLETSRAMHPLQRIGEPEDVASMIAWLLDPANTWITGQVIGVDGGLGAVHASVRSTAD